MNHIAIAIYGCFEFLVVVWWGYGYLVGHHLTAFTAVYSTLSTPSIKVGRSIDLNRHRGRSVTPFSLAFGPSSWLSYSWDMVWVFCPFPVHLVWVWIGFVSRLGLVCISRPETFHTGKALCWPGWVVSLSCGMGPSLWLLLRGGVGSPCLSSFYFWLGCTLSTLSGVSWALLWWGFAWVCRTPSSMSKIMYHLTATIWCKIIMNKTF